MSQILFPVRKRCRTCGHVLGRTPADPVYKGQYDTPACAGMAAPATSPDQAPRECRTLRDGRWVFKRRYRSTGEIPAKILADPSAEQYVCEHCGHWHTGHSRLSGPERFRIFDDRTSIADMLVKARGHATRRQVASVAGIRPIRLVELEEPSRTDRVDLDALFKVARVLHLRLGAAIAGTPGTPGTPGRSL